MRLLALAGYPSLDMPSSKVCADDDCRIGLVSINLPWSLSGSSSCPDAYPFKDWN